MTFLSIEQIREHLDRLTWKDGVEFELHESPWEGPFIRILYPVPDSYNPGETVMLGINTFLPPMPSTDYLEVWLQWRLARIENHESREFFKRDGEIIFDPHAEGEPYHV